VTNTSVNSIPLAQLIAREAIQVAEELDQIRSVYGEDCLSSVKRALHTDGDPDWHNVVERALHEWESEHPRMNFDLIL